MNQTQTRLDEQRGYCTQMQQQVVECREDYEKRLERLTKERDDASAELKILAGNAETTQKDLESLRTKLDQVVAEHAEADRVKKEAEDQQFFMLVNQVNAQKAELDKVSKERDAASAETEELRKQLKEAAVANELRN